MPDAMADHPSYLVVLCGPTASGKTEAAVQLAGHFRTEIISTDSRQVYKELSIGTAKPGSEVLRRVKHHFIDSISVREDYSAGQFERDALDRLTELFRLYPMVIAVGGTGLYIKALTEGFDDIPVVDPATREEVNREFESHGLRHLQEMVRSADPEGYAQTDPQNPQRLIRLLEIYRATGRPRSEFTKEDTALARSFRTIRIGLDVEREALYRRINSRVDTMMDAGLLDEVESLMEYRSLNALQTVGYSELFEFLDGKISLERAVELIKRNSRRYAKRQMTWFRRDEKIEWFEPGDTAGMIRHIEAEMHRK